MLQRRRLAKYPTSAASTGQGCRIANKKSGIISDPAAKANESERQIYVLSDSRALDSI
jgi:hypothetical protein